jgi:hypothetical protein
MHVFTHSKYFWIFIFHLAFLAPLTACAKNPANTTTGTNTGTVRQPNYSNQEFGFSLRHPDTWTAGPSPAPNARVRLATPANTQRAECVVIVKRYPNAASAKQSDIDEVFLEAPSAAELKEILSQSASEVEILAASSGKLHTRPAHLARVRYTVGKPPDKIFVTGRVVMTATPGLTWTISCGGQGNTAAEADKSFQFWQRDINSLISSFIFR